MTKHRLQASMVNDVLMPAAMVGTSVTGFSMEKVLPFRHAVMYKGAEAWRHDVCGWGRHDWGNVHL